MPVLTINERSWAIDTVVEMNAHAKDRHGAIKRIGGEHSLSATSLPTTLYLDAMVFGAGDRLLLGIEFKMPDTPIDDFALLENAEQKARALGLDAFLVWNVARAALHRVESDGSCSIIKQWNDLAHIRTRRDVVQYEQDVQRFVPRLMRDLEAFFASGDILGRGLLDAVDADDIAERVLQHTGPLVATLRARSAQDREILRELNRWWRANKDNFAVSDVKQDQWVLFARTLLLSALTKILSAHSLRSAHGAVILPVIVSMHETTSAEKGLPLLEEAGATLGFCQLMRMTPSERYLPAGAWQTLLEVSALLSQVQFEHLDRDLMERLADRLYGTVRTQASAQYPTSPALAALLVTLGMRDPSSVVLDPCGGSGEIARAILCSKREAGVPAVDAQWQTHLSDRFAVGLLPAVSALSSGLVTQGVARVSQDDLFDLHPGRTMRAYRQEDDEWCLPACDAIVSDLPFKEAALRPEQLQRLHESLGVARLPARIDTYALAVLASIPLLTPGGRAAFLTSNSWLGTQWGEEWWSLVNEHCHVETVIIGSQRWFSGMTKCMGSIIVLRRRTEGDAPERTHFCLLHAHPDDVDPDHLLGLSLEEETIEPETMTVHAYDPDQIEAITARGLGLSACFTGCAWVLDLDEATIPFTDVCRIRRGARRGNNAFFYPRAGHGIEAEFIRPMVKDLSDSEQMVVEAEKEAFVCSLSRAELHALGATGTLAWIASSSCGTNGTGKPWPEALARTGRQWYEMGTDEQADLIVSVNPYERMFVARLAQRSFADQRVAAILLPDARLGQLPLVHALLNTSLTLCGMEGLGFARAEGVLDVTVTTLQRRLRVFDPDLLSPVAAEEVVAAFAPLLARDVLPLVEELERADRRAFDEVVFEAFGVGHLLDPVRSTMERLHRSRIGKG